MIRFAMPDVPPEFNSSFRRRFFELLAWRRDVRRFRTEALPEGTVERLVACACRAPSVGLSQPWRFVLVEDASRRDWIRQVFEDCNKDALASYSGDDAQAYAKLKLAGLQTAPSHIAVFADRSTSVGRGLGRKTMPQMAEYSAVIAVHTLWLAARAENIGLGWVSILDPERVAQILDVPDDWLFIAYLCLGYPADFSEVPELERQGWERRRPSDEYLVRR